jgi:hypothetical protein
LAGIYHVSIFAETMDIAEAIAISRKAMTVVKWIGYSALNQLSGRAGGLCGP